MKNKIILAMGALLVTCSACTQNSTTQSPANAGSAKELKVGGRCEDCEAIFESPIPFPALADTDTLSDFGSAGPRLEVSGTFFQRDGKTPAPGVVMYFYHTDQTGVYPKNGTEKGMDRKHGYLRGWIKTGEDGRYRFYTLRPASYPNSTIPAHIHALIKEPGKSVYWIDDFLFADDPFLPKNESRKPKGGNGVLTTVNENGLLKAKRDIVLGLNIEDYPGSN